MPPIYVVRICQPGVPLALAHWGLFLPPDPGNPKECVGRLYHANATHKSNSEPFNTCLGQWETGLDTRRTYTSPREIEYIAGDICLDNTNVSHSLLYDTCLLVTHKRPFNVNRNCQEWVMEVLRALVRDCKNGEVTNSIFHQMKLAGFVTFKDKVVDASATSSWPLGFRTKKA